MCSATEDSAALCLRPSESEWALQRQRTDLRTLGTPSSITATECAQHRNQKGGKRMWRNPKHKSMFRGFFGNSCLKSDNL